MKRLVDYDGAMEAASLLEFGATLAWVHDLDSVLVRLGPIPIRWYGLSYIAGFAAAWWLLGVLGRRGWSAIKPETVSDLMLALIIGVFVGGRLGYIVFYQPSLLWTFTADVPWWSALAVNKGGMASHGGMLGVVIGAWVWGRRNNVQLVEVMDAMALVAPIGLFFGRMANFINGELLGRIASVPGEAKAGWAVQYPQELLERRGESFAALDQETRTRALALLESRVSNGEMAAVVEGRMLYEDALDVGAARIIQAVQAGDEQLIEALGGVLTARHPSQLYQAFAEGLVVLAAVWAVARRKRRAGLISAWFLMIYGIGRVVTEFWRLPDGHFEEMARIAGLSRGQWLSVGMVVIGAGIAVWVTRRGGEKRVGGWGEKGGEGAMVEGPAADTDE